MKKARYAILGIALSVILATGIYFLLKHMNQHTITAGITGVLLLIIGTYLAIYYQKIQNPHCETCDQKLKLVSKRKTGQEEEIRNGRFVFINTYDYNYHCENCKNDVKISKQTKAK